MNYLERLKVVLGEVVPRGNGEGNLNDAKL